MLRRQLISLLLVILAAALIAACGGGEPSAPAGVNVQEAPANPTQLAAPPPLADPTQPATPTQPADPTSPPPATATGEPAPAQESGETLAYEIVALTQHVGLNGETVFLGLLRNTGAGRLPTLRLTMELRDTNGNPVASQSVAGQVEVIMPGEATPFGFHFNAPPAWSGYEITTDTSPNLLNLAENYFSDFDVENVSWQVDTPAAPGAPGEFAVQGSVTNRGSREAEYVIVGYAVFDDQGDVMAVGSSSADARQPGSAGAFGHVFALYSNNSVGEVYVIAVARAAP